MRIQIEAQVLTSRGKNVRKMLHIELLKIHKFEVFLFYLYICIHKGTSPYIIQYLKLLSSAVNRHYAQR